MGKTSLKALLYAVFCAGGAVCLGGCAEPLDLSTFTKDKDVLEIVDRGSGSVHLYFEPGFSDPDLKEANRRITGLKAGKYYMVEEWSDTHDFLGAQFVSASGERSENVGDIDSVSGGEITGLTNNYWYRVRAAEPIAPLLGVVEFTKDAFSAPTQDHSSITNGAITLPGPTTSNNYIVYALTPPDKDDLAPYRIAQIPISPAAPASAATILPDGNIFTVIGQGTVIDYVFFRATGTYPNVSYHFSFLKVSSDTVVVPPNPGDPGTITITITPTPTYTPDNPPTVLVSPVTYPQNDTGLLRFSINSALYTQITWYIDGQQVASGEVSGAKGEFFDLNKALPQYRILGKYTITVVAKTAAGIPYSADVEVEVTLPTDG
jgi:hypothetical protein